VTTTDGTNNVIVWVAGADSGGDQRLHGYNGDTGAVVYAGGGANELMTNTRKWNTGTVARGRIYFAADNRVYSFRVPEERLRRRRQQHQLQHLCQRQLLRPRRPLQQRRFLNAPFLILLVPD